MPHKKFRTSLQLATSSKIESGAKVKLLLGYRVLQAMGYTRRRIARNYIEILRMHSKLIEKRYSRHLLSARTNRMPCRAGRSF